MRCVVTRNGIVNDLEPVRGRAGSFGGAGVDHLPWLVVAVRPAAPGTSAGKAERGSSGSTVPEASMVVEWRSGTQASDQRLPLFVLLFGSAWSVNPSCSIASNTIG